MSRAPWGEKRSVCTTGWNEEDYDHPTGPSKRQLSLTSFFVSGSTSKSRRGSRSLPEKPSQGPALIRKRPRGTCSFSSSPPLHNNPTNENQEEGSTCAPCTPASPPPGVEGSHPPGGLVEEAETSLLPPAVSPLAACTPPPPRTLQQAYLDCGQARFGQQVCPECGMLYVPGVPEDLLAHRRVCQDRAKGLPWPKRELKGQKLLSTGKADDKIVCLPVLSGPEASLPARLKTVYQHHVARDLGMDPSLSALLPNPQEPKMKTPRVWIYLRKQRVVGFLLTQTPVGSVVAYDFKQEAQADQRPSALLGVAVLWTLLEARGQGIATQLVDAARAHIFFGMVVHRSRIAFSSPTQDGWAFGKHYASLETKEASQKETSGLLVYGFS